MLSLGKMDSKRMVNAGMVYIIVLVVMAFAAFSPVSCAQQVHIELLHAWDSFRDCRLNGRCRLGLILRESRRCIQQQSADQQQSG